MASNYELIKNRIVHLSTRVAKDSITPEMVGRIAGDIHEEVNDHITAVDYLSGFCLIGASANNVTDFGIFIASIPESERRPYAAIKWRDDDETPHLSLYKLGSITDESWNDTDNWLDLASVADVNNSTAQAIGNLKYFDADELTESGVYFPDDYAPVKAILCVQNNRGIIYQTQIGQNFNSPGVTIRSRYKYLGEQWSQWSWSNQHGCTIIKQSSTDIRFVTPLHNGNGHIIFRLLADGNGYYRLVDSFFGQFDGINFSMQKQILISNENEFAIKVNGDTDYVGGYHGHESPIVTHILVDGIPIEIDEIPARTKCNIGGYITKSEIRRYDDSDVIGTHIKVTIFADGSYTTTNTFIPANSTIFADYCAGLACIHKDAATHLFDYTSYSTMSGLNTTNVLPIPDAMFYNPDTGLSARVTAEILKGNLPSVAPEVWDRQFDSKFYYRPSISPSIAINESIISRHTVKFNHTSIS